MPPTGPERIARGGIVMLEREKPAVTEILLTVPDGHHTPIRLDVYITSFVQNATRSKVRDAIKSGFVMVNGHYEKPSYLVQAGDAIEITLPKPPPQELRPEPMDLDIVYEDDALLVVNKPAGMVVHPAFGNWEGTLVHGLLHHTQAALPDPGGPFKRPGIVHRLDKDTSGLLVVAKDDAAHAFLSDQFQRKTARRTYQAVVWGHPPENGTVRGAIGRSVSDRKRMAVVDEAKGKPAVTHYTVLERLEHLSLVEVRLETGRTHQIRVHMSWQGFPVFGDPVYGGDVVRVGPNTGARKQRFRNLFERMPRQSLHAATLGFVHPRTNELMEFSSELPEDMDRLLQDLRSLQALAAGGADVGFN